MPKIAVANIANKPCVFSVSF